MTFGLFWSRVSFHLKPTCIVFVVPLDKANPYSFCPLAKWWSLKMSTHALNFYVKYICMWNLLMQVAELFSVYECNVRTAMLLCAPCRDCVCLRPDGLGQDLYHDGQSAGPGHHPQSCPGNMAHYWKRKHPLYIYIYIQNALNCTQ